MAMERVQKILAQAGIASRRKAEEMITLGLVTVNGKVIKLGDKADLGQDSIKVEGKLISRKEDLIYLAFHKPKSVISTLYDPEGRPCIADYLSQVRQKVFPVGRLDFNSDGLLLLTNDGELSEKIQKSDAFPRIYIVKIKGEITDEYLARLKHPLKVDHRFIKADRVRIKQELNKKTQVEIVFTHGAGIDVKAFFELKGFLVEKITRTTYGNLTLGDLKPGHYRLLNKSQLEALINQPELGLTRMDQESEKEDKKLFRAKKLAQKREAYTTTKTVLKPLEGKPSFKSKFSKNKLGFSNDKPARAGKSTLTAKSAFGKSSSRTPRSDDRPSFGASRPSRSTGAKFKLTVRKKPSSRF